MAVPIDLLDAFIKFSIPHMSVHLDYLILQTSNLDGETNLKIRKALEKTWDYLSPEKASEFKGLSVLFTSLIVDSIRLLNKSSFENF